MACYGEFAHIYDKLINKDINYEVWGKYILEICEQYSIEKKNYLDLACGTGNMLQVLGKNFMNVYGLDLSEDMLCEAEGKARNIGIKAKFSCQNISDFKLGKKFNLITCCLDSTNYILEDDDLYNYFLCVEKHLEDEGLFVFDINSYYKLSNLLGNNIYTYDEEEVMYVWENYFENEVVDMYLAFFVKEGELYRRFNEEHSERAYREEFIENLLNEAGLKVIKKVDNYKEKEIEQHTERITYVVAKK